MLTAIDRDKHIHTHTHNDEVNNSLIFKKTIRVHSKSSLRSLYVYIERLH